METPRPESPRRDILVVGPGAHFLSGVSHYTARLVAALAEREQVAALLLRRLCPQALYPGRERVGASLAELPYPAGVPVFDGLDWYWGATMARAVRFLRETRPKVVVLQWWTGTVAHSYLVLASVARRLGAKVVVEFHEVLDVGEARVPAVQRYARTSMHALLRRADAIVVHSAYDARAVAQAYPIAELPVAVIPHGPYDHFAGITEANPTTCDAARPSGGPTRLLFFGVQRPYKGLEELADAFGRLVSQGLDVHLTVVGEVWQGYRSPLEQLTAGPGSERITVVDRYVPDRDVAGYFEAADLVVLPYRRSSASGPLHIAMSHGLPVVTTAVGGLVEAAEGYTGAVLVPPGDPGALTSGVRDALPLVGRRHGDVASWERTSQRFAELFEQIGATQAASSRLLELVA